MRSVQYVTHTAGVFAFAKMMYIFAFLQAFPQTLFNSLVGHTASELQVGHFCNINMETINRNPPLSFKKPSLSEWSVTLKSIWLTPFTEGNTHSIAIIKTRFWIQTKYEPGPSNWRRGCLTVFNPYTLLCCSQCKYKSWQTSALLVVLLSMLPAGPGMDCAFVYKGWYWWKQTVEARGTSSSAGLWEGAWDFPSCSSSSLLQLPPAILSQIYIRFDPYQKY